ncbi:hypothetical protein PIB30_090750 [Stylosanthes scabra]|uniref:Uncharacterized protein n=1 Tax=Stylosanthes scabra TaxID=79078 RepID=A0ABU6UWP3_9FABA|nr:hypothetical protein [Stylosanthes scabra]
MHFGFGAQSLKRVLIHYLKTSKSLSEPTTFSTYDASDVSSRIGCLPAPDDYSEQVQGWFTTSECRANFEATCTTLLGTFRTPLADLKELGRKTHIARKSRMIVSRGATPSS